MVGYHDHQLQPTQYGFQAHRWTADPSFMFRRAQDFSLKTGRPTHFLFLDSKMAFDKVNHQAMYIALERLGVHCHYINIIQDLYTDQTFQVNGFQGQTAPARPHTGIRQGCRPSPCLSVMVMTVLFHDVDDRLVRQGTTTNTWSVGKPVHDLEYLMAVTKPQAKEILKAAQVQATLYGLEFNSRKTELLLHPQDPAGDVQFVDGTIVNTVSQPKYLGSLVSWEHFTKTAPQHRQSLDSSPHRQ